MVPVRPIRLVVWVPRRAVAHLVPAHLLIDCRWLPRPVASYRHATIAPRPEATGYYRRCRDDHGASTGRRAAGDAGDDVVY